MSRSLHPIAWLLCPLCCLPLACSSSDEAPVDTRVDSGTVDSSSDSHADSALDSSADSASDGSSKDSAIDVFSEDSGASDAGDSSFDVEADTSPADSATTDAGDSDTSVDAGGLPAEQLQAALYQAVCSLRVRCEYSIDLKTCLEESSQGKGTTFDTIRALSDSVLAGKIVMDGVKAQSCIDSISSLSCGAAQDALPETPACSDAFQGTVKSGGNCAHRAACVSGTFCKRDNSNNCAASCVAISAAPCQCSGPQGDAISDMCGFGNVCKLGTGTSCEGGPSTSCISFNKPGAKGEACGGDGLCQQGLTCTSAKCQPLPVDGCSPLLGCADSTQVCVLVSASKASCLPNKQKNDTCTYPMECGGFTSDLVCSPDSHTCVDRPKAGSLCVMAGPSSPLGFCDDHTAYCDSAVKTPICKAYNAIGDTCTSVDQCGPLGSNKGCDSTTHKCTIKPLAVCAP